MSERQRTERAYGPYEHGAKWRIVIVGTDGSRGHRSFESRDEALAYRNAFASVSNTRTVGQAVNEYLEHLKSKPSANANTMSSASYRLLGILRLPEEDRPLVKLTAPIANHLYSERLKEVSVATHHSELGYAKRFFAWCVERSWLKYNPFAEVKAEGTKNRGKPKLRINDSRKLYETVLAEDSVEATAVLTAFLLGMRASEVVNRLVEDLDDDGWVFWITNAKTQAGNREYEIPAVLRERLLQLTDGKGPKDRIFGSMSRDKLYHHTHRLCEAAGVPKVCPHGLRGSAMTNAVRRGETLEQVATQHGHNDRGVTAKRHYLDGGAEGSARGKQLTSLLGKRPEESLPAAESEVLN